MRRLAALILLASLTACSNPSAPLGPVVPEFGSTEPSLWVNGAPMTFASARGSVVLVEGWDLFCVSCKDSIPAVLSLKGRYEARGLRVVSVSGYDGDDAEEPKHIAEAAREEHMTYPCFLDKGMAWQRKAGTDGTVPYFFVIGKDGRVTWKHQGRLSEGSPDTLRLAAAIERALAAGG